MHSTVVPAGAPKCWYSESIPSSSHRRPLACAQTAASRCDTPSVPHSPHTEALSSHRKPWACAQTAALEWTKTNRPQSTKSTQAKTRAIRTMAHDFAPLRTIGRPPTKDRQRRVPQSPYRDGPVRPSQAKRAGECQGETGVARARAAGAEGDHPPKGARSTRASARAWPQCGCENSATARKTGETAPAGAGFGASPLRARGREPLANILQTSRPEVFALSSGRLWP